MTEHYSVFKNALIENDLLIIDKTHISDGTAALPGLSFETDRDTGIYQPADNELAISTGGAERFKVTNSGITLSVGSDLTVAGELFLSDGTAAAPSLAFTSDTNTGLYRSAADQLAITVNGTQVARFEGTQNVFTQNLVTAKEVQSGPGTAITPAYTFSADNNTGIYSAAADQLGISCNGANVATFAATGLTLAAGADLTVAAEILAANGAAATPSITFTSDPNTGIYNAAADQLGVACNGANVATFAATGLTLAAGADLTMAAEILASNGAAATPSITFASDPNTGLYRIAADTLGVAANGAEAIRVDAAGLTVTGAILSTGDIVSGGEMYAGNGSAAAPSLGFTLDPNTGLYNVAADTLGVAANGAEVARFGTTGLTLAAAMDLTVPGETFHSLGTAGAPSITFTGDSNTGIYSPAADQVGFTTAGTVKFYCDGTQVYTGSGVYFSNGGVMALTNGTAASPGLAFDAETGTGIYNVGDNEIGLSVQGTQRAAVMKTGLYTPSTNYGYIKAGKFTSIGADTTTSYSLATLADRLIVFDLTAGAVTLTIDVTDPDPIADDTQCQFTICAINGDGAKDATVAAGVGGVTIPGTLIQITNPAAGRSETRVCYLRKVSAGTFTLY
jgi:hypothetical protein